MRRIKKLIRLIDRRLPIHRVTPTIVEVAPNSLLVGRVALITGGTSGIGFEIAKAFLKAGAVVIITGRSYDRIATAINKLKMSSLQRVAYGMELDNRDVKHMPFAIQQMMADNGIEKIDILVNNAGVSGDTISMTTEEQYDNILDTNLKGVYFLCQYFAHYMVKNQIEGNILNIASSSSFRPANFAYGVSKWGIRGLTEGLARSLAPYGIVVNAIAPGPTVTGMMKTESEGNLYHPTNLIGRYILPLEIANMAVVLVSGLGRTIVGDTVCMTGGSGNITNEDMAYDFE